MGLRRSGWRVLALLVVLGVFVAACGGEDDGGAAPDDSANGTEEADSGGEEVLRIGYDLLASSRGGFSFDPEASPSTVADLGVQQWIYGTLMRPGPDGLLVPDLALRAEVVDPNSIEVELRPDLQLSDGTPLDAELVKAVLDDNLAKPDIGAFNDAFYNLKSVEVTSPTALKLTIPNGTAASWFDRFLSSVETMIVLPDTDYDAPVGAGPYELVSFAPEQNVVLEKNPDYWDAGSIDVERIELVSAVVEAGTTGPPSAMNAGQIDWVHLTSREQVASISGEIEMYSEPDPYNLISILMCKSEPPLDDPKVRQALSFALDREAINDALLEGEGVPAWDLWPKGHRFFNEQWDEHYAHDPDRAKELLAEAGYPDGFAIDFIPFRSMETLLEIVQQQWAEVGVEMSIVPSTNFVQDTFIDRKAPLTVIPVLPREGGRTGHWSGGGVSNMCKYSDPELDALVAEMATVRESSDEAVETMHAISDKVNEDVLSVFVMYQPRWVAHVSGLEDPAPMPYTVVVPNVWELQVTQ